MRPFGFLGLRFPRTTLAASFTAALSLAGCGDGSSDTNDAGVDQGGVTDLGTQEDMGQTPAMEFLACERQDLVIARFDTVTLNLTLLNPTMSDITIDSSSTYEVCQGPARYAKLPAATPVVIPALGTADFDLGETDLIFDPSSDNIALYVNGSSFTNRETMLDFMCWGGGSSVSETRISIARERGADGSVLWDEGGCLQLGGATTISRIGSTDGSTATHYTTSDVTIDCAAPPDMGPPAPVAVPACDREDLVIAGLDLATSTITLLNPTDSTITVDSSSSYQLCQGAAAYSALPAPTPVMIAPGDTADFDLSGISNITLDAVNGTLALYSMNSFTTRDAMLDWMCWGDGAGLPRQNIAQMTGADNTVLWDDGVCTPLAGATALYRDPATDGSSAAHYVLTEPAIDCTPVPPDMGVMDMGMVDLGPPASSILACDREDLVIHSLDTSTGALTVLNPTGSDIIVDSSSPYRLCQGDSAPLYDPLPAPTPVTVPAGGTATFDLSVLPNVSIDGSNGTLALYSFGSYLDRDAMLDFVCWGDGAGTPRRDVAEQRGSDNTVLWDGGDCVALSAPGTIFLDTGSTGASASDYVDSDPSLSCQ